jgi:hypothetical protein
MLDATQLLWTQIAAGICLLLFAGSAYNLLRLRRRMEASKAWIKSDGDIIVSEAKIPLSHTSDDQDDVDAIIRYSYRVGSQTQESDCIKFGGGAMMSRGLAEALVARYPVGARVDVYYDPHDPKSAVLEPRKQDGLVAQLVFTVVFGAAALILGMQAIAGKVLYTDNGVPLFAFAFPLVAFLGAGLSVVAFVNGRRQAKASLQWPTASGTITTSAVVEERIEDKRSDNESSTGVTQQTQRFTLRYRVDLRFVYRVGQRDYVGTTWAWGWTPIYGRRELAEKVTGQYAVGQKVSVHYDPAQPGNAVLEPSNPQGALAPLVFGGVFAVAGALLLAFFINVGFGQ